MRYKVQVAVEQGGQGLGLGVGEALGRLEQDLGLGELASLRSNQAELRAEMSARSNNSAAEALGPRASISMRHSARVLGTSPSMSSGGLPVSVRSYALSPRQESISAAPSDDVANTLRPDRPAPSPGRPHGASANLNASFSVSQVQYATPYATALASAAAALVPEGSGAAAPRSLAWEPSITMYPDQQHTTSSYAEVAPAGRRSFYGGPSMLRPSMQPQRTSMYGGVSMQQRASFHGGQRPSAGEHVCARGGGGGHTGLHISTGQ